MSDEYYISLAVELAKQAQADGEVPVGCIIVKDGAIVGTGSNKREKGKSALAHAEIEAIAEANKALGGWRLEGCTMYVTLEPCPMCAGAIINSRIPRLVYGARDEKAGCCGSVLNLFYENFNHRPAITGGICENECADLLTNFFSGLRESDART